MATAEELLAVVAQVRNELTEIQKTLSLEFAFTEAEHQGALFALQTHLQSVEGLIEDLGSGLVAMTEASRWPTD
jgi:hypothetical protein